MTILMPIPNADFDPTESAVPWRVLTDAGYQVVFATPDGEVGRADERMLTGKGLGIWSRLLRAREDAREHYEEMVEASAFQDPLSFDDLTTREFDGLILPGGHAPAMRPYLESKRLQRAVARHMKADKPLGAICHGVIVVARAGDEQEGSLLRGRKTTALPASMELSAWAMTCLWLGKYYRTYDETVQKEVTAAVGDEGIFDPGPKSLLRDSPDHLHRGFTVLDGNYLSARWPGDAYRFAHDFVIVMQNHQK